jgi:hypothetical protein
MQRLDTKIHFNLIQFQRSSSANFVTIEKRIEFISNILHGRRSWLSLSPASAGSCLVYSSTLKMEAMFLRNMELPMNYPRLHSRSFSLQIPRWVLHVLRKYLARQPLSQKIDKVQFKFYVQLGLHLTDLN